MASWAQVPVSLKLNLQKDKEYTISKTGRQTMKQSAGGQQMTIDIQSSEFARYKVVDLDKDTYDLELSFDTIASKISTPMMTRETNSAKPGKEPVDKLLNQLSHSKLRVNVNTAGEVVGISNYETFYNNIQAILDSVPASSRDELKKQADRLVKESALKSMVEPLFAYLPQQPVKPGDQWDRSYISNSNGQSAVSMYRFTLVALQGETAKITGTSEMETMPSTDPNAAMSQSLKGTTTLEGTIDVATGLMLTRTESGHYEGEATVRNAGQEIKVPLNIDFKTEIFMSK
jgi:hypothetical protein